ncbi:MAG TPA: phosphatase PAP2 family protein [Candidatus Saccharimonadales bacterium]|nr:phosphatase PAP2 family protein [Candidatus Saccharimonadales bacterium]
MHQVVTIIAKDFIIVPVLLAVITWLRLPRDHKLRFIVLTILAGAITFGAARLAAKLYYDPRPFVTNHITPYFKHAADNGFVSDHTLLGTLLAFVTLRYSHNLGYISLIFAVLVGSARVVAGVHHIQDVVGALVISGSSVLLVTWALGSWLRGQHRSATASTASERRHRS